MKCLLAFVIGVWLFAGSAFALVCQTDRKQWRAWQRAGEPYSVAVCDGTDPQELYETAKAALAHKPTNRFVWPAQLAGVARAAFEAGHNDEAQAYAERALATAAESFYSNAKPMSFEGEAYGDATVEANTVLGHLALLRGDVPAAEKCLFLSGQIQPGGTTFWGPRMTLALELLRRHRQDAVLHFLDECSRSWPKECPNCSFEKWAATIRRGKIPDFGATLIYSLYPAYYVSSR
jgi:hypothetical protein